MYYDQALIPVLHGLPPKLNYYFVMSSNRLDDQHANGINLTTRRDLDSPPETPA